LDEIGRRNKIRRAAKRAITPPSLLGIDRKMAYTQRKYHSGLIWIGVTNGLASRKFSGSVNRLGANRISIINKDNATVYPRASLIE
jgi:hypothetical protein